MHSHDYPQFLAILDTLAHGMGTELSEARTEFYWAALDDVSMGTFTGACVLASKYAKKFPLPAELREYGEQVRQAHQAQRQAAQRRQLPETTEARYEEGLARIQELKAGVLHGLPDASITARPLPDKATNPVYLMPTMDPVKRKDLLRAQLAQLTAEESSDVAS